MDFYSSRIFNTVLQASTLFLTGALAWFAFIYYPKIVSDYKSGNFPQKQAPAPVVASSNRLPIETANYRIEFEQNSDTYYVFVQGEKLDDYLLNRDGAKLALKNSLSKVNLCGVNILFVSVAKVEIPERFKINSDCK